MQWYIRYTCILSCRTRHSHSSSYTYTPTLRRHWTPETCEFKSPSLFLFVSAVQLYCVPLCKCTHMVGGWVIGTIAVQLYCCCTVLLLLSPAAARSPSRSRRRSCRRSRAATVARAFVVGPPSSITRRHPFARSLALSPAVARPPSFVRSPAVARPPPLLLLLSCAKQRCRHTIILRTRKTANKNSTSCVPTTAAAASAARPPQPINRAAVGAVGLCCRPFDFTTHTVCCVSCDAEVALPETNKLMIGK